MNSWHEMTLLHCRQLSCCYGFLTNSLAIFIIFLRHIKILFKKRFIVRLLISVIGQKKSKSCLISSMLNAFEILHRPVQCNILECQWNIKFFVISDKEITQFSLNLTIERKMSSGMIKE